MLKSSPTLANHLRCALGAIGVALAGAVGLSMALSGAADAQSSHHSHRAHGAHAQALHGSLKRAHVKMVKVKLAGGRGGFNDPGDDYPAALRNRPQDSVLDQWREYNRECTSFVAWALSSRSGFTMPFHDNAYNWGPRAVALGYAVNSTPGIGSVAWARSGHVAYVQKVVGNSVYIEEYNHDSHHPGTYSARTLPASYFTGYIHFADRPSPPVATPPLQGGSVPIQGSVVPIQGGTTVIQGTPVPVQGTSGGTGGATPTPTSTPAPPATYAETTGGAAHTWTNYTNAGGAEGPIIPGNATVQIACKLQGFKVSDGNTSWYRIASDPWNGNYYVSADAFYNNGQTSGSLAGTPYVDPSVRDC